MLQDAYEMPDGDASGIEEEKAEAEKAVEGSKAAQAQKNVWYAHHTCRDRLTAGLDLDCAVSW